MTFLYQLLLASTCLLSLKGFAGPDPAEFANPSQSYLPRTWMHAMNGNLSKEGFTKDFEALAEAGIGGALVFHIARGIPDGPIAFGSEAFNDILAHAAVEADRVGIEMGLHNCDGWSSSGGPWVTPEQSMKKLVFAQTVVSGETVSIELPLPDHSNDYYEDIAVLAWPALPEEVAFSRQRETLRASDETADLSILRNGNIDTELTIGEDAAGQIWVQSSYPEAVTIRSIVTEQRSRHGEGTLRVSRDGENFTNVGPLERVRIGKSHWSFEGTYPEGISARVFRVVLDHSFPIRRFELAAFPRMQNWQVRNAMVKGSVNPESGFPEGWTLNPGALKILHRGNLSSGNIDTNLPEGPWVVTRYGYTTTAAHNHPASDAGRGLEVDKLDAAAIGFHFDQYVGKVVREAQARGSDALVYSEIDSFEMGGNNWTRGFEKLFEEKWGYDLIRWLPAFTGRVIESTETTDAVLTDMRSLVSSLMTRNYFQRFAELCHEHGMKAYIEPYGFGTLNELAVGGAADMTMGEFWVVEEGFKGIFNAAVSSARIYGKQVISAESFTAWSEVNWRGHPYSMKIYGDHAWASGINETMFHRFAHQPNTHVIPGMTMGSVGSHIDRNQTWWNSAGKAWFKYLARGSYLLQQGNPVSDFLVFTGDHAPNHLPNMASIKLPAGVKGDFVNADVLINRIKVEDGKLVLPEGTSYNVLYLHNCDQLRLATLKRIAELVREGALVAGLPPSRPIGYKELLKESEVFAEIVSTVWGDGSSARPYGKGYVIPQEDAQAALDHLVMGPDLVINGEGAEHFTHRRIGDGELYFFFNGKDEYRQMDLDFRVAGLKPEIWDADSGHVEQLEDYTCEDGRTRFPLTLEPHGSRFVYFRKPGDPAPASTPSKLALLDVLMGDKLEKQEVLHLNPAWKVQFDKAWGGPGTIEMAKLEDWTEHEMEGVRHYSGTAVYSSQFTLPEEWAEQKRGVVLDLGKVNIAAVAVINGHRFPTLWKPPFALDVSSALRPGPNHIQVEVTNTWTNRLIGDEAFPRNDGYRMDAPMPEWFSNNEPPPASKRYTWTAWNFYEDKNQQTLQPSGLKGPVRLVSRYP